MFEGSVSSIPSILAYMNSWLNPHFFFLLLNLMIGTIVFTSTSNNRHQNQNQQQSSSIPTIGSEEFHDPEPDSVQDSGTNFEKEQDETEAPTSDDVYVQTETMVNKLSRASTTGPEALVRSKGRMKKSVSMKAETVTRLEAEEDEETIESRRPATAREGTTEKDEYGVDEKADDFINRFKQQLRLQRMDSIGRQREIGGQKVS